jgi:hypothetical protein
MPRSKKATVDYFPHSCNHGRTIHIIENKFGNDGYSFWFKLLELLGATENHFIDCNDPATWEYLLAKTRLTGETATFILNLLAALDSINENFWKMKVVWSKNFIENLEPIYQRRLIVVFQEADIMDYCKQKHYLNGINANINPQRIGKNRIGKNSKVESIGAKTEKLQNQIQSIKEKFKSEWDINLPFYKTKYPSIDLDFQWANIFDWINRKPKKAKESAAGDLNLFFQRWLNKEKPQMKQKGYPAHIVTNDELIDAQGQRAAERKRELPQLIENQKYLLEQYEAAMAGAGLDEQSIKIMKGIPEKIKELEREMGEI